MCFNFRDVSRHLASALLKHHHHNHHGHHHDHRHHHDHDHEQVFQLWRRVSPPCLCLSSPTLAKEMSSLQGDDDVYDDDDDDDDDDYDYDKEPSPTLAQEMSSLQGLASSS